MVGRSAGARESHRLGALIRSAVGWQVDELHVLECESEVVLTGHARSGYARVLAVNEAQRLLGRTVQDRMEVN